MTYIQDQIEAAYRAMASAGYHPAAPSDDLGNIVVGGDELDLGQEIREYGRQYWAQERSASFEIGHPDHDYRMPFILTIEAARLLCTGASGAGLARKLLEAAIEQIDTAA